MRLLSYGAGTVTISSSSTINGGTTLLKGNGSSISSDGTAFYAVTTKLYVANNSKGTGDSITNPGVGSSFTTTLALPANLPVRTRIHITYAGRYVMTSGSVNSQLDVKDAAGATYCSGEQFHIFNANGNSGNGTWFSDCWITVQTAGASGNVFGTNNGMLWSGDGAIINGVLAGAAYPGYNAMGYRMTGDQSTGVSFDDTTTKTIHAEEEVTTSANLTLSVNQFSIEILLP